MLPVYMKVLEEVSGSSSNPNRACCAAEYALKVLMLSDGLRSASVSESGSLLSTGNAAAAVSTRQYLYHSATSTC